MAFFDNLVFCRCFLERRPLGPHKRTRNAVHSPVITAHIVLFFSFFQTNTFDVRCRSALALLTSRACKRPSACEGGATTAINCSVQLFKGGRVDGAGRGVHPKAKVSASVPGQRQKPFPKPIFRNAIVERVHIGDLNARTAARHAERRRENHPLRETPSIRPFIGCQWRRHTIGFQTAPRAPIYGTD